MRFSRLSTLGVTATISLLGCRRFGTHVALRSAPCMRWGLYLCLLLAVFGTDKATPQELNGMVGLSWEPGYDGAPGYIVRVSRGTTELEAFRNLLCSAERRRYIAKLDWVQHTDEGHQAVTSLRRLLVDGLVTEVVTDSAGDYGAKLPERGSYVVWGQQPEADSLYGYWVFARVEVSANETELRLIAKERNKVLVSLCDMREIPDR